MRPVFKLCIALLAAPLLLSVAHAEGGGDDPSPLEARPVVRRKPRPKPAPAPAPVLPAAPIPYTTYTGTALPADIAHALTPGTTPGITPAADTHPVITPPLTPNALPQPAETSLPPALNDAPVMAAPLPPPVSIDPAPLPQQAVTAAPPLPPQSYVPPAPDASGQISLKCETQVFEGQRFITQGTFFIDLFPSPVFPDANADFQFLFAEPAHDSLIRDSICLDTLCPANVTGAAYYLVNRVTKKGAALRITLNRANGAFYAEEIGTDGRKGNDVHRGEKGFCTPQKLPNALF